MKNTGEQKFNDEHEELILEGVNISRSPSNDYGDLLKEFVNWEQKIKNFLNEYSIDHRKRISFYDYHTVLPLAAGLDIDESIEKLKNRTSEFLKHFSEIRFEDVNKKIVKNDKKSKIFKIELVRREPNNNKTKIIVNENYQMPLEVKLGKYWGSLYELADKGQIANNKDVADYFNNRSDNPLYAKLGYSLTKIVKSDGGARLIPNIKLELIHNKKIIQRQNKLA